MSCRLLLVTAALLSWAGACVSAGAAHAATIRVALAQEAQRVKATAAGGLVLSPRLGGLGVLTVEVVPALGELIVNGARYGGPILIEAREGALSVSLEGNGAASSSGPDEARRPESARQELVVGGRLQILPRGRVLLVVNELDLEEYVRGVVPFEMNASWHPEALKAQAVAARTYGVYQRMMNGAREYDVVAGTQDQVYRGRTQPDPRVQEAVDATSGLVLTHGNAPILAAFSSTAAGPTEDAMNVWSKDLPYLKGVDCPFDTNSPHYQWRAAINLQDLESALRRSGVMVGTIATVTPFSYSRAGRVTGIRILHSRGELILRGEDLRRVVGYTAIPSALFEVESMGREVVLAGRGSGHGVGLCQWGAKELAELGYPFGAILHYYFPGTQLQDLRASELRPPS
jgi:stage II sporulation protein D